MKKKKRIYYLTHPEGGTYLLIGDGLAELIKDGELTGVIEDTYFLRNSGYKFIWVLQS